jgi:predicted nucleic acid-binding protein
MTETANSPAVVIDANILIAICSREENTFKKAKAALDEYAQQGAVFFAPNVLVAEVLFVLCQKAANGILTPTEHLIAVESFQEYLLIILPPPNGESALIDRAEKSRQGFGCSRTSDGLYIALAEELAAAYQVEFLTLDNDLKNQISKVNPQVSINNLSL